MKKVTIAAMAAMVLVTGASANDLTDTISARSNAVVASMQHTSTMIGAGFANTDSTGGAGAMVNFSSVEDIYNIGWSLDGEASKNYYSTSLKSFWLNPATADVYVGGGYLSAKGYVSNGGGCSVAQQINGTCSATTGGSENFTEKGGFGIVGLSKTFDLTGTKVIADAGYRFGGVNGPVASVGVSKKIGSNVDSQILGLKVGFEQIKNDFENIDRMAIYGTLTF